MTELDGLLAGIVSDPLEETRWLVLADWLQENDDVRRSELLRLHRKLLTTCCELDAHPEPDAHPERAGWQSRMVELLVAGVQPCVPRNTLLLPGGVPMAFAFVPPGSFLMGSNHPDGEDEEKPVHRVTLTKGFFLGVHPVTQAQWEAVMGKNPSHFKGENRPVESVSWWDCQEFREKVTKVTKGQGSGSVGLPTEAEWEYACRAGITSEYHYGDVVTPDLVNYNGKHSWNGSPKGKYRESTTEVGSFPSNGWGLYDMHGNVWEWCRGWYGAYSAGDQTDPRVNSNGQDRVLRGGSWRSVPVNCRSASRFRRGPASSSNFDVVGFRVCFRLD